MIILVLLIITLFMGIDNGYAQQSIQQKGNNLVPPGLTNIGVLPCIATAVAPTYTEGMQVGCSTDLVGTLRSSTSAGSSTYLDADGIANQTASAVHGQTYMYNGATWDRVRGTIAGGLQVNCITGCSGGSTTPTDAFANPTTAGLSASFGMMWNGVTWDRIRGTIANGLSVNFSNTTIAVTQSTSPWVENVSQFGGNNVVTGTGVSGLGIPRVTVSNDSNILATQSGTWNINNISGTVSLPTGAATEATLATRLADATFTGRFAAAYVDADTIANQTTTAVHGQCYLYNGVTWDRCRGTIAGGLLTNVSNAFLLDATLTARFPVGSVPADNESNAVSISRIGNFNYVFDGVKWDRWTGAVTQSGVWNIGTVTTLTSITNPVAVTQSTSPWVSNITQFGSNNVVTGVGNSGVGIPRVTISSDSIIASITATVTTQGAKSNNTVVPGATNVGVLPCVATTAAPAYTDTFQVGCSTTLTGDTRVISKTVTLSATGQQAVTAIATALPANAGREVCIKVVSSGTQTVFYGIAGVTTATGQELLPGEKFCAPISNSSQFVVIAGGAGSTVSFEVYN